MNAKETTVYTGKKLMIPYRVSFDIRTNFCTAVRWSYGHKFMIVLWSSFATSLDDDSELSQSCHLYKPVTFMGADQACSSYDACSNLFTQLEEQPFLQGCYTMKVNAHYINHRADIVNFFLCKSNSIFGLTELPTDFWANWKKESRISLFGKTTYSPAKRPWFLYFQATIFN